MCFDLKGGGESERKNWRGSFTLKEANKTKIRIMDKDFNLFLTILLAS